MEPNKAKPNIFVCQGHLYLYWTTGVYYTAQLSKYFNVILIVPDHYKQAKDFFVICKKLGIESIEYYSFCGNKPDLHFHVSNLFKSLLMRYQPVGIIQHDYLGLENMYLFHHALNLGYKCPRIVILSSTPSTKNTQKLLDELLVVASQRYHEKYKVFLPVLLLFIKLGKYAKSLWLNKILPILVLKTTPYFPLSRYSNIDIIPNKPLFDHYIVYSSSEQDYLVNLFQRYTCKSDNLFPIAKFPTLDNLDLVKYICGVEERNVVTFLPSLLGIRRLKDESVNISTWISAIKILRSKLKNYRFQIKFHPGAEKDTMRALVGILKSDCPYVEFINNSEMAEKLIMESKYIIGDVTTSLWWTNYFGGKVAISLVMKNYAAARDLEDYLDIFIVSNIEELKNADLNQMLRNRKTKITIDATPTITEVVSMILESNNNKSSLIDSSK